MVIDPDNLNEILVSENEIRALKTKKNKPYIEISIAKSDLNSHLEDGWEMTKELKTKYKVIKNKPLDELFEDEVWCLLVSLGFKKLNRDRNFLIPYDNTGNLTQQIDVFAMDDETILLVECKAVAGDPQKSNF